jgi:hypothetical protein
MRLIVRCSRCLGNADGSRATVDQKQVGKGAANIDTGNNRI